MTCNHDRTDLVAFHFGEVDEREDVEARLAGCAECLREYFAIKRAIESGGDAPRPSDLVRERVRRAVAKAIAKPTVAPRRWWHRPAAGAIAIAVVLASIAAMNVVTSGPGSAPYAMRE
jgi:anti-sigma factor RsiW